MIGGRTAETTCFPTSQNRRQTEMEASICRKFKLEARACRKFKFSLGGTIFIHETTSALITQGEIDGTTQLLPRLGRLTIDVLCNQQSINTFSEADTEQESNPCRRREREAIHCNSRKLRGMDSTLPHLKDSRERLLDS
jgi:hypothetical protein